MTFEAQDKLVDRSEATGAFDDWFSKHFLYGALPDEQLTPTELVIKYSCFMAWNAAKEDSKPIAQIKFVTWDCPDRNKFNGDFWTVSNTSASVIVKTKEEVEKWAIENGYKLSQ